ncbi:uncharacterized protein LOC121677656 [Alosa sapidissima]|uniref:uncharacterized protein LOC121677656 n=1 Tax=Alosa sapidissima TaxID=34773 RepID=UPI001C09EA8C|nr:uncharacterized protein LOC121677656 [Alosa sapidissima]
MATRLLESFNEFDSYSQEVLSRRSRWNKLNHGEKCSTTFDDLGVSFGVQHDWAFDLPCNSNTPRSKLNIEIIHKKNPTRRQRKAKYVPPPSHKEPRSVKTVCSKVYICPFTSTEDLAQRTDDRKDKEEDSYGFMVVRLNKPQSLASKKYAPHRTKWSRELERLAPMDVHLKYNSKALTGGALHYTNTSHWSSSPNSGRESPISAFTKEENGHFTLPGSVSKVVTEQLQQGNIVRVTTSERRSEENPDKDQLSRDGEPLTQSLPLCLDDELERNHAKVLSARAPTTYRSMPIVSETFPLVYNTGQPHNKPFSSPGFHTLDPTGLSRNRPFLMHNDIRGSKVHSAIVRLTDAAQERHAARLQRMPATKSSLHNYQEPTEDARSGYMEQRLQSLRVLSADGTQYADQDRLHMPSPASGKSSAIPFLSLKQCPVSSVPVGTVLNGINPKQNSRCRIRSPDDTRPPYSGSKTKTTIYPRPESITSNKTKDSLLQKKEIGFVCISKALIPHKSVVYPCLSQHGLQKKVWHPASAQPFHGVVMSPASDLESVGIGVSLFASRPKSHMNSEVQNMTTNTPNPDPSDDQEKWSKNDVPLNKDCKQIISIPTAEIV